MAKKGHPSGPEHCSFCGRSEEDGAMIIGKLADMTLFVVRAGLLERSMLPELDKLYAEDKYANLALVLNGTETAYGRYGYHKYGYRYGYHYGYGNGNYA